MESSTTGRRKADEPYRRSIEHNPLRASPCECYTWMVAFTGRPEDARHRL